MAAERDRALKALEIAAADHEADMAARWACVLAARWACVMAARWVCVMAARWACVNHTL